jgi:type VI secretion system protein ImpA
VAPLVGATPSLAPRPTGRDDALARVAAAARWLRAAAPTDPTAYLLMRGLRWGELRTARGIRGAPAPALLEAPPTAVRARLKGLLMEERWSALLDGVEELLSEPHGRAWLDAQRYTLAACAALGEEYDAVARGVRSALRALLADFPGLPRATLLDDAPAGNPETLAWLEAEGLWQTGAAAEASVFPGALAGSYAPGAPFAGEAGGRDGSEDRTGRRAPLERARAERAAGRPERGVELLARELARERSARARFLRKTEIATVLVESDLHRVAQPILEELLDQIEAHKLEQWEEGGVVAAPMVLMCRTLEAVKGDAALRQKLYLRVCRLDPVAALAVGTA